MNLIRLLLAVALGISLGVAVTAGLLSATHTALNALTAPKIFAIDHSVIYLSIVLGAGFGAVIGTLASLFRHRNPSP